VRAADALQRRRAYADLQRRVLPSTSTMSMSASSTRSFVRITQPTLGPGVSLINTLDL
jgi:hypothetical protein